MKVKNFYDEINKIAPFNGADSWDNVGLIIGKNTQNVDKVLLTLDVTAKTVDYAVENNVNLIISHHPLIFRPINNITEDKYLKLIENKISVICAHTNLDYAPKGVSYLLATKLGIKPHKPIKMCDHLKQYVIAIETPEDFANKIITEIHKTGAGQIGNYLECASYIDSIGQFKPMSASNPSIGKKLKLSTVKETHVQVRCEQTQINNIIKVIYENHPYETPPYQIIPLENKSPNIGRGYYGKLEKEMTIIEFVKTVKIKLNIPFARVWFGNKNEYSLINNVAVCGGAGADLIKCASDVADILLTSDVSYHKYIESDLPIIDIEHFYTEIYILQSLKEMLDHLGKEILIFPNALHEINNLKMY